MGNLLNLSYIYVEKATFTINKRLVLFFCQVCSTKELSLLSFLLTLLQSLEQNQISVDNMVFTNQCEMGHAKGLFEWGGAGWGGVGVAKGIYSYV